jgi:hypothetical protein
MVLLQHRSSPDVETRPFYPVNETEASDSHLEAYSHNILITTRLSDCLHSFKEAYFTAGYFPDDILAKIPHNCPPDTEKDDRLSLVLYFDNARPHIARCIDVDS